MTTSGLIFDDTDGGWIGSLAPEHFTLDGPLAWLIDHPYVTVGGITSGATTLDIPSTTGAVGIDATTTVAGNVSISTSSVIGISSGITATAASNGSVTITIGSGHPVATIQFPGGGHFGDFNGDGHADFFWQNIDGSFATWTMDSFGGVGAADFLPGVSSDWHLEGFGNFNPGEDNNSDVFWQNDNGTLLIWDMHGGGQFSTMQVAAMQATNNYVAGIGDVDHDGNSDIIWRASSTGAITIWNMSENAGTATVKATAKITSVGNDWAVVGMGDFNGDGNDDVLFRNRTDGSVAYWQMDGTSVAATTFLPGAGLDWHIVGTGNFDGDKNGTADIFWTNSNGTTEVWLMGPSGHVESTAFLPGVGSDWTVIGTGDVNGDHKDDVIWKSNNVGGATAVWEMNGSSAPTAVFPEGTSWTWSTAVHHYDWV